VKERPDGTYECALGLAVKDGELSALSYIPRGIDLGCKTALMPSRGKPLDLAKSPRRAHRAPLFANASGVAKALLVTPGTTIVARLLTHCGNGNSLASKALSQARTRCQAFDPERPYRALKLLLEDEDALEEIAAIDQDVRDKQAKAKTTKRLRRKDLLSQRALERKEIHRLGYSPTRKARLVQKRATERARRQRRSKAAKAEYPCRAFSLHTRPGTSSPGYTRSVLSAHQGPVSVTFKEAGAS